MLCDASRKVAYHKRFLKGESMWMPGRSSNAPMVGWEVLMSVWGD